jgi:tetraacyldisaccharide 4'-kinase
VPTTEDALVERLWYGDDLVAQVVRGALRPAAALYGGVMAVRNALYDLRVARVSPTAIPALSVGNLSVGGTGKTPLAAWCAAELVARGAHPAIVLRGYGDDEPLVHRALNPSVPVVPMPDRIAACARAQAAGCDVAVLDDAFQHRRAARVRDLVLVSADRWRGSVLVLPAGPFREPAAGLQRADVLVVTRKAASAEAVAATVQALGRLAPGVPVAQVTLAADALVRLADGATASLDTLRGEPVLAIAAIGDPAAFAAQLTALGARVTLRQYPDHHRFTEADATRLATAADGVRHVVCTLKDAVKLGPLWPRGVPAPWYVSQRVVVEAGADALSGAFDAVLAARVT